MPPTTYTTSTTFRVGVLLAPPPVQLLDLAPVDLFYMLSKDYLNDIPILPQPIKNLAIQNLEILYIAAKDDHSLSISQTNDNNPVLLAPTTANAKINITADILSPKVQPGQLSVLVIPGPDPASTPSEAYKTFIKAHASSGKTDIITICTGIYPACYSGICDGQVVTGPRGLQADLRAKFKNVKQFEDLRWSRDVLVGSAEKEEERPAELWTSAGITNGHDCVAAYIKVHFDRELAEVVCRMADVGQRMQEYENGPVTEGVWWMSRVLRAAIKGVWKL
ncbi:hypothetical protein LTR05_001752 [Lithohypha guttulata]|uniref:DJ-1/PfpI domain-containing protein n=1 Tax=Lithohypha guttulata TaxID=1690604 RepID=A0AAN7T7Y5_9EURO|nr:hypothetical protein LTR05_001752 [Lithohypha guttulata]